MKLIKSPAYAFINSGLHSDTFNLVISRKFASPAEAQETIPRLCERFNSAGLPAAWWTCEEHRNDYVPKILVANGFVESEFDISTPAELRGRSYGSAITHFILQYARNSGARHAALQASPDGLNIYKRMGFRELCTFRVHSNRST